MPVIINRSTGLAENLPEEAAQQALAANTHDVPLYDPQGNPVTAPHTEAANLLGQGYTQPNTDELNALLKHAHFNSGTEQAKTFLEGAAEAGTFGASTAAEEAIGVKPEDIQARREYNPGVHTLGQMAGLAASSLVGVGEAAALERAGQAVAKAVEPFAGRIGSQAAKIAIESSIFQAGDEASKMYALDPNQSAETAASEIGMAGLTGAALGGALGGASQLWKMGPGAKLEGLMKAMQERTSGVPSELKQTANFTIPPEVEAALGDNPTARDAFAKLQESNTSSGEKLRAAVKEFHNNAQNAIVTALGKTPEEAAAISDYEMGKEAQRSLAKTLESKIAPIAEKYEAIEEKFKDVKLAEEAKADAANKIGELINANNLEKSPNESALKLASKVLEQLPKQETAQDIRNYISNLSDVAKFGSENYQIGKQLKSVLRELQENAVASHLQQESPALLEEFRSNQLAYREIKNLLEDLNDRLHVGKHGGPSSFLQALKEMAPEDVLRRLSPKGDVDMQKLISEQFPETANIVKQAEWNKILKAAPGKEDALINATKLFNAIDKLSPEMKQFIMDPKTAEQLTAIKGLIDAVPKRINPSGTARTLDVLWNNLPASAIGIGSLLTGHSGVGGFLLGKIGTLIGKEAPDAVRLAMLRFLASDAPVSAEGLKAAAQMARATIKGEQKLNKSIKSIFTGEAADIKVPTEAERLKIKKQIEEVQVNPEKLLEGNNPTAHYLPEHSAAISQLVSRNIQYLASQKPNTAPLGILDGKRVASDDEEARYNRALNIAQNPLVVLKSLKEGRLTIEEMTHLKAMYPALFNRMQSKLEHEMIDAVARGEVIPYKTRIGLSTFLGKSLDSSMAQQSILSNQLMKPASMPMQKPKRGTGQMKSLDKMPSTMETPQQARQRSKLTGKH